ERPCQPREEVDRHIAALGGAEEERRERIPFEFAGASQRAARERTAEADLSACISVVLVVDGRPPHVEAGADVVLSTRQRDVRLNGVDPVRGRPGAPGKVLELVDVDEWGETA